MNFRRYSFAIAILSTISILNLSSCADKEVKPTPEDDSSKSNVAAATETALDNTLGDSDSGKAMGLQTVHFAFDSFALDDATKSTLKANADILKSNEKMKIQVEGHTDARGGIQYNIALGEKRANSVKSYLSGLGIGGDRITIVSFGKERPLDPGTSEEAYNKNRRANFAVTAH